MDQYDMAHLGDPNTIPWDMRGKNGAPHCTVPPPPPFSFASWKGVGMVTVLASPIPPYPCSSAWPT